MEGEKTVPVICNTLFFWLKKEKLPNFHLLSQPVYYGNVKFFSIRL
jgi:hypothetical protein